jgi:aminoglycoside phosphotransferase (APT) family kinase protein
MTATAPPPAAGVDFDPERLRAYLRTQLPHLGGEMAVERVGGGQSNPTYFLSFDADRLVLRKQPASILSPAAHDVAREYRIMAALAGTDVPVPEPLLLCEDRDVIGTAFYLMRRVEGRIFHQAALPEVPPADRRAIHAAQVRTLARLHAVDPADVGLDGLGRPGSFLDRQVARWVRTWGDDRQSDLGRLDEWLRANKPAEERRGLVHGDFKLNNVIVAADRPELVAVLDWELAAVGDPLLDLGHLWAATWATRPEEYGGILGVDLAAEHLPSAQEMFAEYGTVPPRFYLVLGLVRYAGIFHGIRQRAAAGLANAANAAEKGELADVYIDRALALVDGKDV